MTAKCKCPSCTKKFQVDLTKCPNCGEEFIIIPFKDLQSTEYNKRFQGNLELFEDWKSEEARWKQKFRVLFFGIFALFSIVGFVAFKGVVIIGALPSFLLAHILSKSLSGDAMEMRIQVGATIVSNFIFFSVKKDNEALGAPSDSIRAHDGDEPNFSESNENDSKIDAWLKSIGMKKYIPAFKENNINYDDLDTIFQSTVNDATKNRDDTRKILQEIMKLPTATKI